MADVAENNSIRHFLLQNVLYYVTRIVIIINTPKYGSLISKQLNLCFIIHSVGVGMVAEAIDVVFLGVMKSFLAD